MSIGQSGGRQNVKPAVTSRLVKAEMLQVKSSQVYGFIYICGNPTSFFLVMGEALEAVRKPMSNESQVTIKEDGIHRMK